MADIIGVFRRGNKPPVQPVVLTYDNDKLYWTGYTNYSMNLAEEQDNTYSVANCLAKQWQNEIDNGSNLPDLYIVHIAIGAQGVTEKYMWYPKRPAVPDVICTYSGVGGSINVNSRLIIVDSIKTVLDDEGNNRYKLCGLLNGGKVEYLIDEDFDLSKISKNDAIMVGFSNKNEIATVNVVYDAETNWNTIAATGSGGYMNEVHVCRGQVLSYDNNFIRVDTSKKAGSGGYDGSQEVYFNNVSSAAIYLYQNDKTISVSASEICPGDYVFMRGNYGALWEVIIVR